MCRASLLSATTPMPGRRRGRVVEGDPRSAPASLSCDSIALFLYRGRGRVKGEPHERVISRFYEGALHVPRKGQWKIPSTSVLGQGGWVFFAPVPKGRMNRGRSRLQSSLRDSNGVGA